MIKLNDINLEKNGVNTISGLNRYYGVRPSILKYDPPNKNRRRLISVLNKWSENFDLNCYKKIIDKNSNYFVKFIWLVVLIGSTCATFSLIGFSLISYYDYKVVSEVKIVYERPSEFPAITFCDNNPLSTEEAQIFEEKISNYTGNTQLFLIWDLFLLFHASNLSFGDENRKKLGFSLEDNLEFCQNLEDNTDCKQDLHWYWSFQYGNCWQYNSGLNINNEKIDFKSTRLEGKDNGLYIVIFPLITENKFMTTWDTGLICRSYL